MNTELIELPQNWKWTTLGDIADVVGGGTPKTNDPTNYESGTIPWITPADLSGYTAKQIAHGARFITQKGLNDSSAKMMPAGTVLFTSRAPIGYVAIALNPVCTNQGFKSFVLKEGVLPDYVYWWLKGSKDLAESMASGTTFLELSGAKAKQIPIPVAPLDHQKRIVAEIEKQFSRLDEAVANLKRVKANLKRYKAAVLKSAVEGRLVETEAELARREGRSYETGAQLLQRILEARHSQWLARADSPAHGVQAGKAGGKGKGKYKEPAVPDTTDLSELPEGWVWATVEQLVSELMNGYGKRSQAAGKPRIVLRLADVADGDISYADVRRINCTDNEIRKYVLARNDLLILRVNGSPELVGRFVLVRHTVEEALFCDHFIRVRCAAQNLAIWLRIYADTKRFRRYIDLNKVSSAGQNTINQSALLPFAVPLPPAEEQQRIVAEVDRRLSLVREVEAQVNANLKRAARLRQSILMSAFSINRNSATVLF